MIDLRSDTVTRPTAGMRAAMAAAEVGDDVYAEDPTVNALEERVAALFGHEAAMFTPTGSMANQIAVQLLVPPGDELLCDADAHIVTYEVGAAAAIGGISTRTWPAVGADVDVEAVSAMVRPAGYHAVATRAIAVEQTHNRGGGGILALSTVEGLRRVADAAGLALHCDGARIWHAHVADGVALDTYGGLFDTLSVCLSKGLGAPIGSLVIASAERIERARVRTNIVPLDLSKSTVDGAGFGAAARERGVLVSVLGPRTARLVTHLDVDDAAIERAIPVLTGILS